ncbi:MAG: hypothetical protein KME06_17950 [Kastovskya adunca ATA6-11-RM4]|jgi:hypothetical protein|nr:hypothetical protein [Kastovskya adunca ATA6-11-RM4]
MNPTQDPIKWTDSVNAIGSVLGGVGGVVALLTYLDGRRKGKTPETILQEILIKGEIILVEGSSIVAKTARSIAPNSEVFQSLNINLSEKKEILEDKLNTLQARFRYSQQAQLWLERNRQTLSRAAVKYALDKHPDLVNPDNNQKWEEHVNKFYQHVNYYIDLIAGCLKFGRPNLLEKSPSFQAVAADLYLEAFIFIKILIRKQKLDENLSGESAAKIQPDIDNLIEIDNLSRESAAEIQHYLDDLLKIIRDRNS